MISASTASLTYSIGGAPQVAMPLLSRGTQGTPIAPKTSLHYASGNDINSNGGALGFNLADVSSVEQLNMLPVGRKGLVWIGLCNGAKLLSS